MTFRELLSKLEHVLGYHHLPVNPQANRVQEIFDSSPVHTELMTRIVRTIYHDNGCHKLDHDISVDTTNQTLAMIRLEILRSRSTDIDVYHFIEEVCRAVHAVFSADGLADDTDTASKSNSNLPKSAQVIGLAHYRHLKSLA